MIYRVDQVGQILIGYGMLMDDGIRTIILIRLKKVINLLDGILKQMEMEAR